MPLDPNIILQGRVPDVGSAIDSGILNASRLSAMQTEQLQRDMIAERLSQLQAIGPVDQATAEASLAETNMNQMRSSILDSARQLQPILDSGDANSARRVLFALKDSIRDNPQSEKALLEIDEIIRQLDEGDLESAKGIVEGILSADKSRRSPYHTVKQVVIDNKTYEVPFDARSGRWDFDNMQLSPKTPEQQGAVSQSKASGSTKGEAFATAEIDFPKIANQSDQMIRTIDSAISHPGFKSVVGMPSLGKGLQFVGGTDEASFRKLHKQITGQVFMKQYETLKGGGQITEIEGEKGTEALSRLDTALSEEDYVKAAEDLKHEIRKITTIAELRAQGNKVYNPTTDSEFEKIPSGGFFVDPDDGQLYRKP